MPDARFVFLNQYSKLLDDFRKLLDGMPVDLQHEFETTARLLDENNHDLERYLDGAILQVSGFNNMLTGGGPPGGPPGGLHMRIDGDRVVLFPGRHITYTTSFAHGVLPFVSNGYNPLTTDQVIVEVDETTVTLDGFDIVVWVNGVIDLAYAPIVYWFAFGW